MSYSNSPGVSLKLQDYSKTFPGIQGSVRVLSGLFLPVAVLRKEV